MVTSLKKREQIIKRAAKNFNAALESYQEVEALLIEYGQDPRKDNVNRETLAGLAKYYENCIWWKKEPGQ